MNDDQDLGVLYIGGTYYGPFGPAMLNDAKAAINKDNPDYAKSITLRSYRDLKERFIEYGIEIP